MNNRRITGIQPEYNRTTTELQRTRTLVSPRQCRSRAQVTGSNLGRGPGESPYLPKPKATTPATANRRANARCTGEGWAGKAVTEADRQEGSARFEQGQLDKGDACPTLGGQEVDWNELAKL
jgi:hypothetical protein